MTANQVSDTNSAFWRQLEDCRRRVYSPPSKGTTPGEALFTSTGSPQAARGVTSQHDSLQELRHVLLKGAGIADVAVVPAGPPYEDSTSPDRDGGGAESWASPTAITSQLDEARTRVMRLLDPSSEGSHERGPVPTAANPAQFMPGLTSKEEALHRRRTALVAEIVSLEEACATERAASDKDRQSINALLGIFPSAAATFRDVETTAYGAPRGHHLADDGGRSVRSAPRTESSVSRSRLLHTDPATEHLRRSVVASLDALCDIFADLGELRCLRAISGTPGCPANGAEASIRAGHLARELAQLDGRVERVSTLNRALTDRVAKHIISNRTFASKRNS